ncbi:unnamed protein product [Musa textilis]
MITSRLRSKQEARRSTKLGPMLGSSCPDPRVMSLLQCKHSVKLLLTCNARTNFLSRVSSSSKASLQTTSPRKCLHRSQGMWWTSGSCELSMYHHLNHPLRFSRKLLAATRAFAEDIQQEKSSENLALISRLTEEKNAAIQQNNKLQQELVSIGTVNHVIELFSMMLNGILYHVTYHEAR